MIRRRQLLSVCRSMAVVSAFTVGCILQLENPVLADGHSHLVLNTAHPTKIVTIEVVDQQQLNWLMSEIGLNPLSCRPGPGSQPFHASVEQLERISKAGTAYVIDVENAEAMFKAERDRINATNNNRGASWFDDYKTRAQINTKIDELVTLRPDLVTKLTVGTSHEGNTIFGMRISGSASTKPAVLFSGTQHAREWISPMTNMWIATELVERYDSDAAIQNAVDSIEFFIIPVVNPDGYLHSWSTYRLWRKNRRDNGGGVYGVDLNRNWDIDWNGPESTSNDPNNDLYVGPSAFSEPETASLRDFVQARPNIVAHIDFHAYGQIILQAWGYTETPPADQAAVDALGADMRDAILTVNGYDYPHAGGGELIYLASGTCSDWTYSQGLFGYTIELRPTCCTFELPAVEIIPTAQELFQAALVMADWAATPLGVLFPNGKPDLITPNQPATFQVDITSRHGETLDSATATLLYRSSARGTFTEVAMTPLGGSLFEATLPAIACGSSLDYYVRIDTDGGQPLTEPVAAPTEFFTADALDQFFALDDDFEIDLGWTTEVLGASSGQWQRGVPVDDPNWSYDPASDADGSGQCWLTQNELGNTDIDGGAVRLTSPSIDMTGGASADDWQVRYDYYLYLSDTSSTDAMFVEVSSNDTAGPWFEVIRHDTHGGSSWNATSFTGTDVVAAGATLTSTMRFRFTASDDNPPSIVEAGVDGFASNRAGCDEPIIPGDIVAPFGSVDVFDLLELLNNWGTNGPGADIAVPLDAVDVFDLLELLANWG